MASNGAKHKVLPQLWEATLGGIAIPCERVGTAACRQLWEELQWRRPKYGTYIRSRRGSQP
eukprot:4025440-Prymnesium_polylepis.1